MVTAKPEDQVEAIEPGGCAPPVFVGSLTERQPDRLLARLSI